MQLHPRIKEVHDYLVSANVHLHDAVEPIPAELRDTPPGPERWSVAHVLEHLAIVEGRIAQLIAKRTAEGRAAGVGPEREESTVLWTMDVMRVLDRTQQIEAPETVRPTKALKCAEAMDALKTAQAEVRAAVVAANGLALTEIVSPNRVFGPLNLYQWGAFAAAHEMRHALQIREIGEQLYRQHAKR